MDKESESPSLPQETIAQIEKLCELILYKYSEIHSNSLAQQKRILIGICGIPGSGKTTIGKKIEQKLKNCVLLGMDGFHIARKNLNEEGMKRRGAAFTFDLESFEKKIKEVRSSFVGNEMKFPSFDHKVKDPVEDDILIPESCEIILIEGLYVFDKHLSISQIAEFYDLKIWVAADKGKSVERVALRHYESGIEKSLKEAEERAEGNDGKNADYVLENCYEGEDFTRIEKYKGGRGVMIENCFNW